MTISEVFKVDLFLKKNISIIVEYRDPFPELVPLYKLQLLMKAQNFIHFLQNPQQKLDGDSLSIIYTLHNPYREIVEFAKKHNIGVHDSGKEKPLNVVYKEPAMLIKDASLNVDQKELSVLVSQCSDIFVIFMNSQKVPLDYSLVSLDQIDKWIKENISHLKNDLQGMDKLVLAGCYCGEVLRREMGKENFHGEWVLSPGMGKYPLVLDFSGNRANVLGKLNRQVDGGHGDEIAFFVKVVIKMVKDSISNSKK